MGENMKNEINEITHFEIPAKNPNKLRQFYSEVFGWKFKNSALKNLQYWKIDTGTKHRPGVEGGMYKKGSKNQTPLNYISTSDINEAMAKVEHAGGHITVGKKETLDHGFTAIGTDPEGNPIGLFESTNMGMFRERGKQSQSGADRIKSSKRNNATLDSK